MAMNSVITLTIGDVYYQPALSNFPSSLPTDTPIYVQVDSFNFDTNYGSVYEIHEISSSDVYNNISGPVFPPAHFYGKNRLMLWH
jgi:hypothetical protein